MEATTVADARVVVKAEDRDGHRSRNGKAQSPQRYRKCTRCVSPQNSS